MTLAEPAFVGFERLVTYAQLVVELWPQVEERERKKKHSSHRVLTGQRVVTTIALLFPWRRREDRCYDHLEGGREREKGKGGEGESGRVVESVKPTP